VRAPLLFGRRRSGRGRGQSLVEYAIVVPVFLLMLLGMLELGLAFSQHLTMEYATREGARVGAALGNGTDDYPCTDPNANGGNNPVDRLVIAAVQRVLTASGSQVSLNAIQSIRIYKANGSGGEVGPVNVWTRGATAGTTTTKGTPLPPLVFKLSSYGWNPCTRKNDFGGGSGPDSIGVSFRYTYSYVTPLGALMGATGNPTIPMSDKTIMALNPANQ